MILSETFEQHLELVWKVLATLKRHGIKIKPAKCKWFHSKVKFLGHMLSYSGISKLPEYIEKVNAFPRPTTVKQLREFLGLVNFQRKFAPNVSTIGQPLFEKTGGNGKRKLQWTSAMNDAFMRLKEIMSKEIELAFPDYSIGASPLDLYVDASGRGVGHVLVKCRNPSLRL